VRIITNNKSRSHTNPIFSALQLLKVDDIFKVEVTKVMYKFTIIFLNFALICLFHLTMYIHIILAARNRKTTFCVVSIHHRLKNLFAIMDQKYGITDQLKLKIKNSFNSKVS